MSGEAVKPRARRDNLRGGICLRDGSAAPRRLPGFPRDGLVAPSPPRRPLIVKTPGPPTPAQDLHKQALPEYTRDLQLPPARGCNGIRPAVDGVCARRWGVRGLARAASEGGLAAAAVALRRLPRRPSGAVRCLCSSRRRLPATGWPILQLRPTPHSPGPTRRRSSYPAEEGAVVWPRSTPVEREGLLPRSGLPWPRFWCNERSRSSGPARG